MANQTAKQLTAAEESGLKTALLVSSGVLVGLGLKNKFVRRLTALACVTLTAGLALPAVQAYLDKKQEEETDPVFSCDETAEEPAEAPETPETPAEPAL